MKEVDGLDGGKRCVFLFEYSFFVFLGWRWHPCNTYEFHIEIGSWYSFIPRRNIFTSVQWNPECIDPSQTAF